MTKTTERLTHPDAGTEASATTTFPRTALAAISPSTTTGHGQARLLRNAKKLLVDGAPAGPGRTRETSPDGCRRGRAAHQEAEEWGALHNCCLPA